MPATPHSKPRSARARRAAQRVLAGLLLTMAVATLAWAWQQRSQARQAAAASLAWEQARERGRLLFEAGDEVPAGVPAGVPARMPGHTADLPPLATRCSNCHALLPTAGGSAAAAAPALGGDWLTQWRPRRGGPPSRFDAALLCRLLSTGRDPADVVVDVRMPRYAASQAQCQDLWVYLTGASAAGNTAATAGTANGR